MLPKDWLKQFLASRHTAAQTGRFTVSHERQLLPALGSRFIKAHEAKLARGKDLVDLYSSEQLGVLFDKEKLAWLDASITSDSFPDFHRYLIDLVDGIQVTPDSLVSKLTDDFLNKQSVAWLIKLIQYAEQGAKALKQTPFIRLRSGEQATLPENLTQKPTAWFAPNESEGFDLSDFPLICAELAANESVRTFLKKEGIGEVDEVDMVVKSILPKYENTPTFGLSDYLKDLHQIAKAYTGVKKKLENHLMKVAWLACVKAGSNRDKEIVWKQPSRYSVTYLGNRQNSK